MGINERGKEKSRGRENRNRKPVLLIATEGKNKTEKNYLSHFAPFSKYAINFNANHYTDPVNMMKSLVNDIAKKKLNVKDGDRAVCIFDTDMQMDNKQDQIDIAMKYQNNMIK